MANSLVLSLPQPLIFGLGLARRDLTFQRFGYKYSVHSHNELLKNRSNKTSHWGEEGQVSGGGDYSHVLWLLWWPKLPKMYSLIVSRPEV